ncbi:MAG TPA: 16S rRNA (cytosine(1402)-N(4))-methyltransferase RsmH [Candidatus Bathyarchaeia archaeon]|nr:16S rRNA (cytosine(1402)-N(4))-methyltransferase RsmH [Candidatus Bathyarchaeia archaeon]
MMIHKSVLLGEVIENLKLRPGMAVVDGTLGAGGHSEEILKRILPGGRLISIDWDERAIQNFEKKLTKGISIAKKDSIQPVRSAPINIKNKNDDKAFSHFVELGNRRGKIVGYWHGAAGNYANIEEIVRGLKIKTVDAILVDLGFSSDQIEDKARGFSFLQNGPLDMRYSQEMQEETAANIVNKYAEVELARIFREMGEENFSKRIAREIAAARKAKDIEGTAELVRIISAAIPERYKKGRVHFATKVFQALRIETNHELENLKKFLREAVKVLASEGILAIISFHSLEDRIVKKFFREESQDCVCPPNFPKCVCDHRARLKAVTKRPVTASESEVAQNPRARSAKLRVAKKL